MAESYSLSSDCGPYFDYRKLLDTISTRLHKENALRLANLYELPSWYFEVGPSHDPSYALRVLIAMEGKGVFAPDNLKGLADALKTIQREDLCSTVKEFISKYSCLLFPPSEVSMLYKRMVYHNCEMPGKVSL